MKNTCKYFVFSVVLALGFIAGGCRTSSSTPVGPTSGAFFLTPPAHDGRRESYFAINGSKAFHIPEEIDGKVQQRFDWMRDLGVGWDRIDIWWHVTEPRQDTWDFSRGELVFDAMEKNGILWYPILCYGAAWFPEGRTGPMEDEDFADFAEYVYETITHFQGRAKYWSLWNEPNIPNFWSPSPNPDAYARLLEVSHAAAMKADPDAMICAPALAPLGSWDRKFTERIYQLGAAKNFDVFDYHYYRNHPPEQEVPAELAEIRAVMARYGDAGKPIWISESGVSGMIQDPAMLDKQAALVVRNQLLCLALGVERFFYFDLQNWYDDKEDVWDSQLGLVTGAGEPKPAYYAYKTLIRETDYKTFVGRLLSLGDGIQGVLIHDPEKNVYTLAVWLEALKGEKSLTVALKGSENTLVLEDGSEQSLTGPITTVAVTQHPRYIRGVSPDGYLPEAGIRLSPTLTIMAPGESARLQVEVHPLLENPDVTVSVASIPDGLVWNPKSGEMRLERALPAGKIKLEADVTVEYGPDIRRRTATQRCAAEVEVVPVLTMTLRPIEREDEVVGLASLVNQSTRTLSGVLSLVETGEDGSRVVAESEEIELEGNQTLKLELPVDRARVATYTMVTTWHLEFGEFRGKPFHFCPVLYSAEAPVIDARLDEWSGLPALVIGDESQIVRNSGVWTPRNASSEVRLWLTPELLNFAMKVVDNDPMQNPNKANDIWKGDSFEVYVGFRGPTDRTVFDRTFEFQIGVAPTTSEGAPMVYWFHIDKPIEAATLKTRKTDDGYIMEGSIPLDAIDVAEIPLGPGSLIGLDTTMDDYDADDWAPAGNIPGRALIWNGGPMNWIDPSGWGIGVLQQP